MELNKKLIIWNEHIEKGRKEIDKVVRQIDFLEGRGKELLNDEQIQVLIKASEILWKLENDLVFEIK